MATSGLFNFGLSNSGTIFEAFDRISIRPPMVDRHMMASARNSLNLELLSWSNESWNYWKTTSGTINLVVGQATYLLPANLVTLEELYLSQVNGNGAGVNADRIMTPMERTQYSEIPNKLQTGNPTSYWFQMVIPPQVTIWETPQAGFASPNYILSWYGLQQIQDATLSGGENPDIAVRASDALCARLTLRLAEKFGPSSPAERAALIKEKGALAEIAWENLQRRDQEPGPTTFRMNTEAYRRM